MGDARNPSLDKTLAASIELEIDVSGGAELKESDLKHVLDDVTGPTVRINEVEFDD